MELQIEKITGIKFKYNEDGYEREAEFIEAIKIYFNETEDKAYVCVDFDNFEGVATLLNLEDKTIRYDDANGSQIKHYARVVADVDIFADVVQHIEENGCTKLRETLTDIKEV